MKNFAVYAREVAQVNGSRRKEVFKTYHPLPDPAWGDVTCITRDARTVTVGDAMIEALVALGYQQVPMK